VQILANKCTQCVAHLVVDPCIFDNARHKIQTCDSSTGTVNHQVQDYQTKVTENKRRKILMLLGKVTSFSHAATPLLLLLAAFNISVAQGNENTEYELCGNYRHRLRLIIGTL
jgi:hypothetical protein